MDAGRDEDTLRLLADEKPLLEALGDEMAIGCVLRMGEGAVAVAEIEVSVSEGLDAVSLTFEAVLELEPNSSW